MPDFSPEEMDLLATQVIDLLLEYDMMEGTVVYGNYQRFSLFSGSRAFTTPAGRQVYADPCTEEDIPGRFKNAAAVTLTFEGNRLFEAMNFRDPDHIRDKLDALFSPFDLYLEQGYEWLCYAKVWEP